MSRLPLGLVIRARAVANIQPFNSTRLFNPCSFRQLSVSSKVLPLLRLPSTCTSSGIEGHKSYKLSSLSHNCGSYLFRPVSNPVNSIFKLTNKRAFHSSPHAQIKFMFSRSPKNGDKPIVKIYKVSPLLILFTTVSLFTFILTSTMIVIPFIFHFFSLFLLCSSSSNSSKDGRKMSFTRIS